jgi:hypothetical protein
MRTFQAAASWLNKVMKDEKFHSELSKYEIEVEIQFVTGGADNLND